MNDIRYDIRCSLQLNTPTSAIGMFERTAIHDILFWYALLLAIIAKHIPDNPHVGSSIAHIGMHAAMDAVIHPNSVLLHRGLYRSRNMKFRMRWNTFACVK